MLLFVALHHRTDVGVDQKCEGGSGSEITDIEGEVGDVRDVILKRLGGDVCDESVEDEDDVWVDRIDAKFCNANQLSEVFHKEQREEYRKS